MSNPFLSEAVFVSPSLNRTRVIDLPGIPIPKHLRGLNGYDLLSSQSLQAMVISRACELGLQAGVPDLLRAFNGCFIDRSSSVRSTAQQIAEAYGRRLALLLLTLKRADPINRRARTSWDLQHWEYWQQVTTIHIGGGLLSGAMGLLTVASAQDSLHEHGFLEMRVQLSTYGAYLPLAGLARMAPPGTVAMLLLDFGQTDIKRIVATYKSGENCELVPLPKVAAHITPDTYAGSEQEFAEASVVKIINTVAQSWRNATDGGWSLDPVIGINMACYMVNGHPPSSEMGYYGRLQLLAYNLQTYLAAQISEAIGREIRIILKHDGSAAGLVYAGLPQTVALMLGTAVGVGFPPDTDQGLLDTAIWKHLFY